MDEIQLNSLAETLSNRDKKDEFKRVIEKINEMKSCIENLECVYDFASQNDIKKRLLDISYKQTSVADFILSLEKDTYPNASVNDIEPECKTIDENVFKVEGNKEEGFIIHTPFPPVKMGEFRTELSKVFAEKISQLLNRRCRELNENLPLYSKADVHFILYIGRDIDNNHIPDADNLDLKNILDAMQLYLFPDDNLITISYKISGKRSDKGSRMEVHITEKHM